MTKVYWAQKWWQSGVSFRFTFLRELSVLWIHTFSDGTTAINSSTVGRKGPQLFTKNMKEKMAGDIKSVPKICRKSQQQCSPLFKTRELSADNCYTEFTISKPFVLKHCTLFYTNIHSGVRLERNEITNKITFFEINIICLKYYDWLSSAVKLCKWFTVSIFSLTLSYMHGTNKEFCNLSLYRVYL